MMDVVLKFRRKPLKTVSSRSRSNLAGVIAERGDGADGVIGVFQAPGDRWSFVRLGQNGQIVQTAEKRRISDWATTGLYHFSRGRDFVRYSDAMIAADERVNGEFYVIPVYNRMIADGTRIYPEYADDIGVMGTPEDLVSFLAGPVASATRST